MTDVLIVCGGTGGHLAPGIALAEELNSRDYSTQLYISEKSIDGAIIEKYNTKSLHIAAVTSVAGERGRYKNITYSSSKAALSSYLSSIRQKYSMHKITTIKLGMVKTKMTSHLNLNKFLTDTPEDASDLILRGLQSNKEIIISFKWKLIMFVIKMLPEAIFKRLKF